MNRMSCNIFFYFILLIDKLLGKNIGFITMREKLKMTWKLEGGFDLIDISNKYFVVKFDIATEREKSC